MLNLPNPQIKCSRHASTSEDFSAAEITLHGILRSICVTFHTGNKKIDLDYIWTWSNVVANTDSVSNTNSATTLINFCLIKLSPFTASSECLRAYQPFMERVCILHLWFLKPTHSIFTQQQTVPMSMFCPLVTLRTLHRADSRFRIIQTG